MGLRRLRSTIDAVARAVNRVQEAWEQGKMAHMLLMDVKGAFDHVSKNCLLRTMEKIDADGNFL